MVYPYKEILFDNKKKYWKCPKVGKLCKHAKWKKQDTKEHIFMNIKNRQIYIESENRLVVTREWGVNWVSFWGDASGLDLDIGDSCTALWIY